MSTAANVQTVRHANPADAWADPAAWNAIAGGVPFRTTDWLQPWWRAFGKTRQACVLTVHRDGELIGGLPLSRPRGSRTWDSMAAGRTCTDHVSVLCRPDDRDVVTSAIAKHLIEHAADPTDGWHRCRLDGVISGDPAVGELLAKLHGHGCGIDLTSQMSAWVSVCERDWDTFLAGRSKRLRYQLRHALRTHEKFPGLRYEVSQTVDEVRRAATETIDLHQARWVEDGEPGSFGEPAARQMIEEAIAQMHAAGRLYLPTLRLGDKLVAGAVYFVGGDGRLYCYCTGVDHDCDFAAGNVLNAHVLHHAHQTASPAVDLLRGDEVYKDRLQCHPTPVLEATITSPHLMGRVRQRLDQTLLGLKQSLRRVRQRSMWRCPTAAEAFGDEHRWLLPQAVEDIAVKPHDREVATVGS